jgi:hypothetical protein
MQRDTRRLTVAREHLKTAYDEITLAQGQAEQSMVEAAVGRRVRPLVLQPSPHQVHLVQRAPEISAGVERAYAASRRAWQAIHDFRNLGMPTGRPILDTIRNEVIDALSAVDEVVQTAETETTMHA